MSAPRPLVIVGATATGKTDAALALARRFDAELVGADSVQVYRGFDVGSAKPDPATLGGVPHHLIDVLDPDEGIDARRWAEMAERAVSEVEARGRRAIVVGGTGLWIRALLRGLVDVPPPDPAVRGALEGEVARLGAPALHARLAAVDPRAAGAIHPRDALRIVRALEVFEQTGRPLGELRAAHARGAPRLDALVIGLDVDPAARAGAIERRFDAMIAAGWLEEIAHLLARWGPEVRAFRSVGYRQLVAHVSGDRTFEEARRQALKATRDYARRQRNWFAGEPYVTRWARAEEVIAGDVDPSVGAFFARGGARDPG